MFMRWLNSQAFSALLLMPGVRRVVCCEVCSPHPLSALRSWVWGHPSTALPPLPTGSANLQRQEAVLFPQSSLLAYPQAQSCWLLGQRVAQWLPWTWVICLPGPARSGMSLGIQATVPGEWGTTDYTALRPENETVISPLQRWVGKKICPSDSQPFEKPQNSQHSKYQTQCAEPAGKEVPMHRI